MSLDDDRHSEPRHGKGGGEQDGSKATKDNARSAIQYFMNNAPPGALREVMETCELLVDPSYVSSRFMEEALEHSAAEQRQIVSFSFGQSSYQAVLCHPGRLGRCVYLHPQTRQRLLVAAAESELVVTQVSEAPAEAFVQDVEPYSGLNSPQHQHQGEAVETELTKYLQEQYSGGAFRALRVAPVEFWRLGQKTQPDADGVPSEASLEGDACVRSHISEDFSAQSSFRRQFPEASAAAADAAGSAESKEQAREAPPQESEREKEAASHASQEAAASPYVLRLAPECLASPDAFAKAIAKEIKANEEKLSEEISNFFSGRALQLAKGLRRSLPLYGQAFDWKQQNFHLLPHLCTDPEPSS